MRKYRSGNITIEIDDQDMFANIHLHGRHDRIVGSLSIPRNQVENLVKAVGEAKKIE